MAKQDFDFAKVTEEFLGAFKIDTAVFDDAAKNVAEFNAKLGKIALVAAKKNAELTSAWTTEALKKAEAANKVQKSSDDYSTIASEFAAEQSQTQEKLAAYAEVAKTAQTQAAELFVAAGKEVQKEVAAKSSEVAAKAKAA